MAQKKEVKVRDLKPSKDAKGGAARASSASMNRATNSSRGANASRATMGGGRASTDGKLGRSAN